MADRRRGRPQEDAGADHYTVSEAAEIIDVTDDTIRAMILDGRLIGDQYRTTKGEPRYRATKESVHAEAARRGKLPTNAEVETTVEDVTARSRKELLATIGDMFAETFADSDTRIIESFTKELATNRAFSEHLVQSLRETLVEQHEKTRSTVGELTTLLREVKEAEDNRRETGLSERRGFFRRLFYG